ncbi:hypothetical protein ABZ532_27960 [Streptomyces sp. NPDC019396]|uniref:hypothetical protein n=1 Tax=Streptomyces sp. NPDC019396 TaxID=3154687 RepID=UPI003400DAC1
MTPEHQHSAETRAAAHHFHRHLGRRRFLTVTAAASALAFAVNLPATRTSSPRRAIPESSPPEHSA